MPRGTSTRRSCRQDARGRSHGRSRKSGWPVRRRIWKSTAWGFALNSPGGYRLRDLGGGCVLLAGARFEGGSEHVLHPPREMEGHLLAHALGDIVEVLAVSLRQDYLLAA